MAFALRVENLFWIAFVAAAAALIYAGVQIFRLWKLPEEDALGSFSRTVRKGAAAFLKRQCLVSVPLFALALLALFALEWLGLLDDPNLPLAFLSGGICATLASLAALALSLLSNARVATGVNIGAHNGFNAAFTASSAAAFAGIGVALGEVFTWFFILRYGLGYDAQELSGVLLLLGAGAAYAAFLTRLGGGIFAKAADLSTGAAAVTDETAEPRTSPGVVADCVGDNVINAAGAAGDLYAGYVLAILAVLAVSMKAFAGEAILWSATLYPAAVAALGVAGSLLACLLVKAEEDADERALLTLLRKNAWIAAGLTGVLSAPLSYLLTGSWSPFAAVAIGLLAAQAVSHLSSRASSNLYPDVRRLAGTAENGVFAELTVGAGLGLRSASATLLALILAILAAFLSTGGQLDAAYETLYQNALARGLYGVALAGLGFLSTTAYTLSAALLSPITDNADCTAKVVGLEKALLCRTGLLNSLGGCLANLSRSLSTSGTLLLTPALVWLYTAAAKARSGAIAFSAASPALLVGAFGGVILLALFISLLFTGVYNCAQPMAAELRRQSRGSARQGGGAEPGYASSIDLCARGAALYTIAPGLFGAAVPFGSAAILGPEGTVGLLLAAALLGLSGAVFLSGTGSVLDCARRRVELERRGGMETRRSAAVADMIGGLFKDVTGPALGSLTRVFFTLAPLLATLATGHSLLSLAG